MASAASSVRAVTDHAAYLDSSLKVFKADTKAIFTAASHAQRAAGYLNRLQPAPAEGEVS